MLAGVGLLPFFALQLPIVLPVLAVTATVGGGDARLRPAADMDEWGRMLRRIVPYSGAVVLSVVYFQVAQIMVSLLSTSHQTGYFGVSFRVLVAFTTLPPLLVSSALPLLARAARDDNVRFTYAARRLAETMVIAGAGLAVIVFLGAAFAIHVVAGTGYGQSIEALRILAAALIGTFVIAARGYALLSLGRLRAMFAANAVALLVVAGVGIPLILTEGAVGAAIALTVAELTLAGCYEWALTSGRREPPPRDPPPRTHCARRSAGDRPNDGDCPPVDRRRHDRSGNLHRRAPRDVGCAGGALARALAKTVDSDRRRRLAMQAFAAPSLMPRPSERTRPRA